MQPNIMITEKAIEPIGESKSDAQCVLEVAKKFPGMEQQMTEGKTTADLQKAIWGYMGGEKLVSWEQLKEKGYWIYSTAEDWEKDPPGFREFYLDPEKHKLNTPTGKLEFYSEALAKAYPDDKERGPIPKWVEKSHNHDERLSSPRARMYPAPHHVQPRPLARACPVRRYHLDPRNPDHEGHRSGRLQIRTVLVAPRVRLRSEASKTATSSRSSTSAASSWPGPISPKECGPALPISIMAPGTIRSKPAKSSAAERSTPSPRAQSPAKTVSVR